MSNENIFSYEIFEKFELHKEHNRNYIKHEDSMFYGKIIPIYSKNNYIRGVINNWFFNSEEFDAMKNDLPNITLENLFNVEKNIIVSKDRKCIICGNDDVETWHNHHSIESCIGGNNLYNIVRICSDCHGIFHYSGSKKSNYGEKALSCLLFAIWGTDRFKLLEKQSDRYKDRYLKDNIDMDDALICQFFKYKSIYDNIENKEAFNYVLKSTNEYNFFIFRDLFNNVYKETEIFLKS